MEQQNAYLQEIKEYIQNADFDTMQYDDKLVREVIEAILLNYRINCTSELRAEMKLKLHSLKNKRLCKKEQQKIGDYNIVVSRLLCYIQIYKEASSTLKLVPWTGVQLG